ncbi:hypothetical protein JOD31_000667 [Methylopila capsulata]|uniref:Uncharacterized protein n=1 Tax=Methylopila capsulata TaxID=61654 RepID=A0A9W6IUV7_9HYPH|nr:hypothetical protein [Methylopila capsulata]MBM7850455.1 hypothetical protein [Methylopila capsulata]GLK55749.1 hypothetical protein GCM10008170_17680 [Methylopila capsulata]
MRIEGPDGREGRRQHRQHGGYQLHHAVFVRRPKKDTAFGKQTAQMVRDALRSEIADWYMQERRPGGMIADDAY